MNRSAFLALFILVAAGCAPTQPSGTAPGTSSLATAPLASPTSPMSPTPAASHTPSASPESPAIASPSPDAVKVKLVRVDPAIVLQVCETYEIPDPDNPPDEGIHALPCEDAIGAALAWLGDEAATVGRADVRYSCFDGSCPARDPDRAYVTVVSEASTTQEVTVARTGDGLWIEGVASRPALEAPAFTPPRVRRPDIAGAPSTVAHRTPLPLCGEETAPMGGPYDEAARTCFLDGVLAGSPVELITHSRGTEGQPGTVVYRFEGRGIVTYTTVDDHWESLVSGIRLVGNPDLFVLGGRMTRPTPLS